MTNRMNKSNEKRKENGNIENENKNGGNIYDEARDRHGEDSGGRTGYIELGINLKKAVTKPKDYIKEAVYGCGAGVITYFLSVCAMPFATYPFGLAMLCSAKKYVFFILCGAGAGAVVLRRPDYLCVYIAAVLVRLVLSMFLASDGGSQNKKSGKNAGRIAGVFRSVAGNVNENLRHDSNAGDGIDNGVFRESTAVRLAVAFSSAFLVGITGCIIGGFQYYDLFGLVFMSLSVPVIAFLYTQFLDTYGTAQAAADSPILSLSGIFKAKSTVSNDGGQEEPDGATDRHGASGKAKHMSAILYAAGTAAVLLSVVYSASALRFLGFYIGYTVAATAVLLISKRYGVIAGALSACLSGLVSGNIATALPVMLTVAVAYSLPAKISDTLGIVCACIGAGIVCFITGGLTGLLGAFPSVAFSVPLFLLIRRFDEGRNSKEYDGAISTDSDFAVAVSSGNMLEESRSKMRSLSDAFSSLSEIFYDLSDRFRRPQVLDLRRICDSACSRHCEVCYSRDVCWGAGYGDTLNMINNLAEQLHIRGHADVLLMPEELRLRCLHIERIVADANRECAKLTEALLKNDKTAIFASDYEAISSLLNDALTDEDGEYKCDRESAYKIYEYLTSRGISVHGVVVCGKRYRKIIVRGMGFARNAGKVSELRNAVGGIVGAVMSDPVFEIGTDCTVMMLVSQPMLAVTSYAGSVSAAEVEACQSSAGQKSDKSKESADTEKEYYDDSELSRIYYDRDYSPDRPGAGYYFDAHDGYMGSKGSFANKHSESERTTLGGGNDGRNQPDNRCGDTTNRFSNDRSYYYALISDGMGSGSEAMFTSRICSVFLEKMLRACNRTDVTLRMLNSFIRSKNSCTGTECSATVDLMELDLLTGNASFAKSGAAPTYIVRDGSVFILRSRTLPIGIIRTPDVRITKSEIKADDIIIMVSDGVTQNNDECPWLVSLLSSAADKTPEKLVGEIIEAAGKSGSRDDISAVVMKVSAAG